MAGPNNDTGTYFCPNPFLLKFNRGLDSIDEPIWGVTEDVIPLDDNYLLHNVTSHDGHGYVDYMNAIGWPSLGVFSVLLYYSGYPFHYEEGRIVTQDDKGRIAPALAVLIFEQ